MVALRLRLNIEKQAGLRFPWGVLGNEALCWRIGRRLISGQASLLNILSARESYYIERTLKRIGTEGVIELLNEEMTNLNQGRLLALKKRVTGLHLTAPVRQGNAEGEIFQKMIPVIEQKISDLKAAASRKPFLLTAENIRSFLTAHPAGVTRKFIYDIRDAKLAIDGSETHYRGYVAEQFFFDRVQSADLIGGEIRSKKGSGGEFIIIIQGDTPALGRNHGIYQIQRNEAIVGTYLDILLQEQNAKVRINADDIREVELIVRFS